MWIVMYSYFLYPGYSGQGLMMRPTLAPAPAPAQSPHNTTHLGHWGCSHTWSSPYTLHSHTDVYGSKSFIRPYVRPASIFNSQTAELSVDQYPWNS